MKYLRIVSGKAVVYEGCSNMSVVSSNMGDILLTSLLGSSASALLNGTYQ